MVKKSRTKPKVSKKPKTTKPEVKPRVVEYIKTQLKAGYSVDVIKEILLSEGFSVDEIERSLKVAQISEKEFEKKPEEAVGIERVREIKMAKRRPSSLVFGFLLTLIAGAVVLNDVLGKAVPFVLATVSLTGILWVVFNGVLGIGLIVLAFLILMPGMERIGGILILILSIVYMVCGGFAITAIIGIIGGILVTLKGYWARLSMILRKVRKK